MKFLVLAIALTIGSFAQANQLEASQLAAQIKAAIDAGNLNFLDFESRERVLFQLRATNRLLGGDTPGVETTYGCVSIGHGNYGFYNLTTGKQIGLAYSAMQTCQASLPKPGVRYACISTGHGNYGFFDLQGAAQMGLDYSAMQTCVSTLPVPGARFACISTGHGNYGLYNLGSRQRIGQDYSALQTCQASLPK